MNATELLDLNTREHQAFVKALLKQAGLKLAAARDLNGLHEIFDRQSNGSMVEKNSAP